MDCRARHRSVRLRRLSLPQVARTPGTARTLRRPRDGRQPLSAVGQRDARRVGTGTRRPEPLALRDHGPRAAPARGPERPRGGRLELRRAGAGGAGHLADGVPAAGRHEGRAGRQQQRIVESGAQPRVWADPVHAAQMRGYFVAGPGERLDGAKFPWGWETDGFDDTAWAMAARRCPTAAPTARRGRRRTPRTGGCSCRGRFP